MNIKHRLGSTASLVTENLLCSRLLPLTRYFPRGINWTYDVQRFANTRRLNTIFDVGANIGQTVFGLVKFFPEADIHCFEPALSSFEALQSRYGDRAKCHRIAFGESEGHGKIRLYADSELNSFLPNETFPDTGKSERVRIATIDGFCAANDITTIDVLKMDVQGWELQVLAGARQMLSRNKIRFLFSEVAFESNSKRTGMTSFGELHDAVSTFGFRFCGFYHFFRYGPTKQYVSFANALYINTDFQHPVAD